LEQRNWNDDGAAKGGHAQADRRRQVYRLPKEFYTTVKSISICFWDIHEAYDNARSLKHSLRQRWMPNPKNEHPSQTISAKRFTSSQSSWASGNVCQGVFAFDENTRRNWPAATFSNGRPDRIA
jgi:hypothetical protein